MSNEVTLYGSNEISVKSSKGSYELTGVMGGCPQLLKRNVDFGKVGKSQQPSLFKSGAEKVCKAFGLLPRFKIESKIEQFEPTPFFYYNVLCELVKINPIDGREYVFATAYGSANTSEKRCGFQGAFDAANSSLKMAQKRALVGAAITIGGISDMFTQDIENETFMSGSKDIYESTDDNAPINAKQVKRIFAIAADGGMNAEQAKNKLNALGFATTKDVLQKDYDYVCGVFAGTIEPKVNKKNEQ